MYLISTQTNDFRISCLVSFSCIQYLGVRYKCPGGRYGDKDLETSEDCTEACMEGHWCGEASTSPTENECGSPNVYCPRGSLTPKYVR